jgi:hypothetical protein
LKKTARDGFARESGAVRYLDPGFIEKVRVAYGKLPPGRRCKTQISFFLDFGSIPLAGPSPYRF